MAELVDAPDSKSGSGNRVRVRFSLPAPSKKYQKAMKYCSSCATPITRRVPDGDSVERWVCEFCDTVHYQNPKVVVGCIPNRDGKILLCKRAIEPRYGYWTVPAGFMEMGETIAEGAARETLEEACATVLIGHLFASVDVPQAGQLHLFFTAKLESNFSPGTESLEVALFSQEEIPWGEIAFRSGEFALRKYFEDAGKNNGVHTHEVLFNRGKN
tara:strand:+ start:832 stop:1473 length:642 start_codon:yes stop_codon:yes gene_type:complete